ncbi:MAG TPA: DinB family protein [Candidatus Hydrogenedentes bacterium]|nr:DinB family protein [Candidatus Hydrogenedentota bacterium]HIB53775.1 DinB family protein [Nitrospirales bacterium]
MTKQELINQVFASKTFLDKSTDVLTEEDSGITPVEGMMTAAQQIAHIAQTADWFLEGVFGDGFNMDFEESAKEIMKVTSLSEARDWLQRSYDNVVETVGSKSEEELAELTPESSVMGSTPKVLVLGGIPEHTAHHRGALTVYTRLAGKVPSMPYM